MPSFIEQELKALAYDHAAHVRIHGKDVLAAQGEYVPEVVLGAPSRDFLGARRGAAAAGPHRARRAGAGAAAEPLPKRPPAFCTGCPERPVFSALKIAQRELGETHVAADIGCHAFATLPPFNQGNTILGYGMSVASASAVAPNFDKRVISILGDGGFWHYGLTAGVANAVFNKQDSIAGDARQLLHLGHRAAGQPVVGQEPPRRRGGHVDPRGHPEPRRVLDQDGEPYRVADTLKVQRRDDHRDRRAQGHHRARGVPARAPAAGQAGTAARLKAGGRVEVPRFGVDPDVCTGDNSCMRLNGCPSLTLKRQPRSAARRPDRPRRRRPAWAAALCGEVAHAAVLCPSFYEARVIHNPGAWARGLATARRRVIGWLQPA